MYACLCTHAFTHVNVKVTYTKVFLPPSQHPHGFPPAHSRSSTCLPPSKSLLLTQRYTRLFAETNQIYLCIQIVGSPTLFRNIWKAHDEIEERTPTDHDMCSTCVEFETKRQLLLKRVRAGDSDAVAALSDLETKRDAHREVHAVERRVHDLAKHTSECNPGA